MRTIGKGKVKVKPEKILNNQIKIRLLSEENLVKESIRSETIERVDKCKEWTRAAIPKIILERTGKEATPEFIDGATKTFGFWWLGTLEQIKRDK